jgi:hypothetical protein
MGRGADLAGVGAIPQIYILGLVMLELLGFVPRPSLRQGDIALAAGA